LPIKKVGDDHGKNGNPSKTSWTPEKNRQRSPPNPRRCPRWPGITVHDRWNTQPNLRAIVVFSAAGYSFDRSSELRARLLAAVDRIAAPVFFIHAENDYSLSPGEVLDARRELTGKPHRLKIYPPIGVNADEGHDFLHIGVNIWEPDVFAFLDENM
jgi:pimeloyl-ACP methyl ester carboxylesterase